jgi:predicted RNA binding protein YcfA (HicA-like mRNA interferase family)
MAIAESHLGRLTAREVISPLNREGFLLRAWVGSHLRHCHPDGRRVTGAGHHPRETCPFNTLTRLMTDQARWRRPAPPRAPHLIGRRPRVPKLPASGQGLLTHPLHHASSPRPHTGMPFSVAEVSHHAS